MQAMAMLLEPIKWPRVQIEPDSWPRVQSSQDCRVGGSPRGDQTGCNPVSKSNRWYVNQVQERVAAIKPCSCHYGSGLKSKN